MQRSVDDRLAELKEGTDLDWNGLRDQISHEHEHARDEATRVRLLAIHKAVMDSVERSMAPGDDLERLRGARRQEYSLFITRECVRDGNVVPALLDHVTRREIEAGRMREDDPLRTLTRGAIILNEPLGPLTRIRRWFGRQ